MESTESTDKNVFRIHKRLSRWIDVKGYIRVRVPSHPYTDPYGRIMEHRLNMEEHLGRYLVPAVEDVHHKNGDVKDNRIENLELISHSKHSKDHMLKRWKEGVYDGLKELRAEKSPNWRGGTQKHEGYVVVRSEGHPKAWRQGHYTYRHVLVMEQHLGRYLEENECVAHINGIKDDDRLENLRLWKRKRRNIK